jgi:hypothetical protein
VNDHCTATDQTRAVVRLRALVARRDVQLAMAGFVLYLVTRLVGLTRFPAYFFADEAVQTTLADGLLHNGWRDSDGVLLPPYLRNVFRYNLSLSVYVQVIPTALFGRSIWVTRATSVMIGALVVPGVCVALRMLRVRTWWLGAFVMACIPVWFLHSRTAFEVVISVAAYACFLAAYLWYRLRSPAAAPVAVAFGAATAYAYANGQALMLVTGLLLLAIDAPYHWQRRHERALLVRTAVVTIVCVLPWLRHRRLHPTDSSDQLKMLGSYWYSGDPVPTKLGRFVETYSSGLDPRYWFGTENTVDPVRHVMVGMGHVWWVLAPYALVGLIVCLVRWRSPGHRVVLVALLAAPFSASLVEIIVTRTLVTVVPLALLMCIGVDESLRLVTTERARWGVALVTAGALTILTVGMTQTALARGERWTDDYGMSGLQWGGEQVYAAVEAVLRDDPAVTVLVGSDWANSPHVLADFHIDDDDRERVRTIDLVSFFDEQVEVPENTVFVLSAIDLDRVRASDKIVLGDTIDEIPLPDGRIGFTVASGRYVDDIEAIYAAEREERNVLQPVRLELDGAPVELALPALGSGEPDLVLDGDPDTLVRGLEANPFVMELRLDRPTPTSEVVIESWSTRTRVRVVVSDDAGEVVSDVTDEFSPTSDESVFVLDVRAEASAVDAKVVRIEMSEIGRDGPAEIHVREVSLR